MKSFAFSGGKRLTVAGTYHLAITSVDETPKYAGKPVAATQIYCSVLSPGQKGKLADFRLFDPPLDRPAPTSEQLRIEELLLATGVVNPLADIDKVVDLQSLVGTQVVVAFDTVPEKAYLRAGEFLHVDDPAVLPNVLDKASITLIPGERRRDPADFEGLEEAPFPSKPRSPKPVKPKATIPPVEHEEEVAGEATVEAKPTRPKAAIQRAEDDDEFEEPVVRARPKRVV
jgi:hypothetical protein